MAGSEGAGTQQCVPATRLFLAYASDKGRALIDRELYLTEDPDRWPPPAFRR